MSSSGKSLTVFLGSLVIVMLFVFVALASVAASFAWIAGGGYGSGPNLCQPISSNKRHATTQITPSSGGSTSTCVKADQIGSQVVAMAQAMADALYVNPACGGRISYPDCYYTWYKAPGSTYPPDMPTFPQAVIQYGELVCPGCAAWQSGTYQCVSFVRGAYSQVYPMRLTANAFDLWAVYAIEPGWREIPSASAPVGERGIPRPGDVMIFKDASIGHAAIVMSVQMPTLTTPGAITFSNANSISPYTTMPLLPDLSVNTASWPGYTVWGYIRPNAASALAMPSQPINSTYT